MGTERILLVDDAATAALGARLADTLEPGDLVLLSGGLGAGKTALARAIIRRLTADPSLDVPSPTFALVQPYDAERGTVLHADLYRIGDPREIEELDLIGRADAIVLVEWPERAPELAARATLTIHLDVPPDGTGRIAVISR